MTTIAVKNWERFQHYGNREPTWIKLYRDMLTSEPWVLGTDLSRLVQVAITLLAARYQNAIPYQWGLIKKVASLDCKEKDFREAVDFLSSKDFLEIQQLTSESKDVEHSASVALAPRYAREEKRREEENRGEERRDARERALSTPGLDAKAFDRWDTYRSTELRKPLGDMSVIAAAEALAKYGDRQSAVVEQSIANKWQGLFELKLVNGSGSHKPARKPKTVAELEAEEASRAQH